MSIFIVAHLSKSRKNEPPVIKSQFEVLQDRAGKGDAKAMAALGRLYVFGDGVPKLTSNGWESVGNTIAINRDKGQEWLRKAAALGNADAMNTIGDVFYQEWQKENSTNPPTIDPATGLPTSTSTGTNSANYGQSMAWYRKAAELGDTNAMWSILIKKEGIADVLALEIGLFGGSLNEEDLQSLRKLADGGDTRAMTDIGKYYLNETNAGEGLIWLHKSADLGNALAWTTLASAYASGSGGVETNVEEAIRWYTKAATNGDIYSEFQLAELYRDNEEVRNSQVSFRWFLRVAQEYASTNPETIFARQALIPVAEAYDKGLGVAQDSLEAIKWYTKAAEDGSAEAQWRLGLKYDLGEGVGVDKQMALQWYLKAANAPKLFKIITPSGVAEAQRNLGYLYRDGEGVARDMQEALDWFRKAAENGDPSSQYEVGKAYDTGVGILQDKEEALKWYRKAAYQGDKAAQLALGNLCSNNLESSQNRIESYTWYTLAAAGGSEAAAKLRDIVAPVMTAQELAEANRRARAFSVGEAPTNNTPAAASTLGIPANAGIDLDKPAFEVLNTTAKVTEQNDVWWRYGYRLTVRNNGVSTEGQWFEIQFLDAQGYVIDTTTSDRTVIKPGVTEIITGETLINLPGAAQVSKLKAVWKR
ncbi:MAG: tetratricopeptide repeat protein [Verrucomicrobiota bacterium]